MRNECNDYQVRLHVLQSRLDYNCYTRNTGYLDLVVLWLAHVEARLDHLDAQEDGMAKLEDA
jgi:hypothetical protein